MLPMFSAKDRLQKLAWGTLWLVLSDQDRASRQRIDLHHHGRATEMTWLNFRDAEQIGIHVAPWPSARPSLKATQEPSEDDLANRARAFVTAIQSRWSDANSTALNGLDTLYAPEVTITANGFLAMQCLRRSVSSLSAGRNAAYKIKPNSMTPYCSASECVVTGNIEWEARSRTRNAVSKLHGQVPLRAGGVEAGSSWSTERNQGP